MKTENVKRQENDAEAIDLMHILSVLWKRAWIIILSGIVAAAIGYGWASFMITPLYSSSVMMYVNNTLSVGSISAQIQTSRSMVDTYIVILNNRTTLNKVIENTGLNYSYGQISGMLNVGAVNETEVIRVTVTAADPYDAEKIANEIAVVLPERVSEVIEGASVKVIDRAIPSMAKVSPSITRYTAMGLMLGIAAACGILIVIDLLDSVIRDEDYIMQTYDIPILARVPDLLSEESSGRGYYGGYRTYGHQGHRRQEQESEK